MTSLYYAFIGYKSEALIGQIVSAVTRRAPCDDIGTYVVIWNNWNWELPSLRDLSILVYVSPINASVIVRLEHRFKLTTEGVKLPIHSYQTKSYKYKT